MARRPVEKSKKSAKVKPKKVAANGKPNGAKATEKPVELRTYEKEIVAIDDLKKHPRNYKTHPEDQLLHLGHSIKAYGYYRNIVTANDLTILAGHGVVEAAKKVGLKKAPIHRMPFGPDDPRAIKLVAIDNESGRFAEVDDRQLAEMLKEISKMTVFGGLLGTGYDERQVAAFAMTTRPASELANINEAAEWLGMPEYDPGGPQVRLVVSFKSVEDRDRFVKSQGLKVVKTVGLTWSTQWPVVDLEDTSSLRFEARG